MTIRRFGLVSDSSTDQSLGSTSSYLSKASLLSIPQPRKLRSRQTDKSKQFLALHARYIEDSTQDKSKIRTETAIKLKKKPRRIKRTNAFYLNRSAVDCDLNNPRLSCTSDDSSRLSVSREWASHSSVETTDSCESLDQNGRSKRKIQLNSALILGRRDILINLKKKMKKKIPKYQGSLDVLQKKVLTMLGPSEYLDAYRSSLLKSRATHQSFEHHQKRFLGCSECSDTIIEGELVICSNESPPKHVWHPHCFKCHTCSKQLVDLVYHPFEGRKYCDKHKPYLSKVCSYCMEEINYERFTKANGRYYHPEHFQCWQCAKVLSGDKYYGCGVYPMCTSCYDTHLAKTCKSCKCAIQIDTPFYSLGRKRWHATPECFRCMGCKASLVGAKFIASKGELFCNKQCFSGAMNSRVSCSGRSTCGSATSLTGSNF